MALIWAEGLSGANALAPKWRAYALAEAKATDATLSPSDRGAATAAAIQAKKDYTQAVAQAETALAHLEQNRTHVLIAGVGAYDDATIPGLTTSIHGATALAEWMLTRFTHAERPLASVEMLLSPPKTKGPWKPSNEVAAKLGLASGDTLPLEAATFGNFKGAFDRWLTRAGVLLDNAAWLYFSGHGVYKTTPMVLPQDAKMPTDTQGVDNIVDLNKTAVNMLNRPPSIHCFFIDACQEVTPAILYNRSADPGKELLGASNAVPLEKLDWCQYHGSFPGMLAYGPDNAAPFFTQELLKCLEKRGAQGKSPSGASWMVTTTSLRQAMEAASIYRMNVEKKKLKFTVYLPNQCTFTADLCHYGDPSEAFVRMWCKPKDKMPAAKLFVLDNGSKRYRSPPGMEEWYTTVSVGQCEAGAEFDARMGLAATPRQFSAAPPQTPIEIPVQAQNAAGAGSGGGT